MRPFILLTNDDGIHSPGLMALAEALAPLGELLVVAPRFQQTGMGRSFPRTETLGIIEPFPTIINGEETTIYGVHGSPAFAVAHAVLELAEHKPDLCVSGINYGENLGLNISCSGTLGAALEADTHDIPAVAVSREVPLALQHQQAYAELDWEVEKEVTARFIAGILANGMGEGVSVWNLNLPAGVTADTEVRLTCQSRESGYVFQRPDREDRSRPLTLQSRFLLGESLASDGDSTAIYRDSVISATPLNWNMTVSGAALPGDPTGKRR